jgi:hypothetical protein
MYEMVAFTVGPRNDVAHSALPQAPVIAPKQRKVPTIKRSFVGVVAWRRFAAIARGY